MVDASRIWVPDILERIASFLPPNEVACNLRLVDKVSAAVFRNCNVVRLSQPAPQDAFARRWSEPGAFRAFPLARRRELLRQVTTSGVIPNLRLALEASGCSLRRDVLDAAAAAGHLSLCRWCHEQGCAWDPRQALKAAARGGHVALCEWLLTEGSESVGRDLRDGLKYCVLAAARAGHVGLMELLLRWCRDLEATAPKASNLVAAAAEGCDLATLQRLISQHLGSPCLGMLHAKQKEWILAKAAGSPKPDWQAKVEWLEAQGCPRTLAAVRRAAAAAAATAATVTAVGAGGAGAGGVAADNKAGRLAWLRRRGYPLCSDALCAAVGADNLAAVKYLLDEAGLQMEPRAVAAATNLGRLDLLLAQHAHARGGAGAGGGGVSGGGGGGGGSRAGIIDRDLLLAAAGAGHLPIVVWAMEASAVADGGGGGGGVSMAELGCELFGAAAQSGNLELMAWLRKRGCPWDGEVLQCGVNGCCEAAVEWLVESGCPVPKELSCAVPAMQGDIATLRLLGRLIRRLGCRLEGGCTAYSDAGWKADLATLRCLQQELRLPVRQSGVTLQGWIEDGYPTASLQWLVGAVGRRLVDWGAAVEAVQGSRALSEVRKRKLVDWLGQQQQQHQHQHQQHREAGEGETGQLQGRQEEQELKWQQQQQQ